MRKSTVTVTLALLSPTLLAGCSSRTNQYGQTSNSATATTRGGGGGFFRRMFGGSSSSSSSTRGGFGSFGRGFSGGS